MTENAAALPSIPERRYERPPIVEALCEIYFTGSRWDATVPGLFYERVRREYPQKSEMAMVGIEVKVAPGQAETRPILPADPRMRFARDDNSRLVQLARDQLVVNQLRPYPHYEQWREAARTSFELYRELAEPAGLSHLGVRYINRINVPCGTGGIIPMEDYFRVYPEIPKELGGVTGLSCCRYSWPRSATATS